MGGTGVKGTNITPTIMNVQVEGVRGRDVTSSFPWKVLREPNERRVRPVHEPPPLIFLSPSKYEVGYGEVRSFSEVSLVNLIKTTKSLSRQKVSVGCYLRQKKDCQVGLRSSETRRSSAVNGPLSCR